MLYSTIYSTLPVRSKTVTTNVSQARCVQHAVANIYSTAAISCELELMELQRCLVNDYSFSGGDLPVSDFTVYSYHETLHIMHNLDPRRKLIHRKLSRTAKISLNGEKQPQRGQS